jgi:uncharacterized protein YjdB
LDVDLSDPTISNAGLTLSGSTSGAWNFGNRQTIDFSNVETLLPAPTSLSVTPSSTTIPLGTSQPFTATGHYAAAQDAGLNPITNWSSDATGIATVSPSGEATGVGQGTAHIQATVGSVSNSATLTVGPPALTSISVSPPTASVAAGLTVPFTATGHYSDNSTKDLTNTVTWTAGDPSIATVSSSGVATGVKQGMTTITAASGGVTSSPAELSVAPPALTSISVSPRTVTLSGGLAQQFTATGHYTDGSSNDLTARTAWSSSSPSEASVSASGLARVPFTAPQGGTTITASFSGLQASANLTVSRLVSITISPAKVALKVGQSRQLSAIGHFANGASTSITDQVAWFSVPPFTATVSPQGVVRGWHSGRAAVVAFWPFAIGVSVVSVTR